MLPMPPTPSTPRLSTAAMSSAGTRPTATRPAMTSGLVASRVTIRSSARSESTSSERRRAGHRWDVQVQEAVGGAPVQAHEPAAGRGGAKQQRQADPDEAQRGAEH